MKAAIAHTDIIHADDCETTFRIFDVETGVTPTLAGYKAVGNAHYHGENAVLYGFHGEYSIDAWRQIAENIRGRGKRWLIVKRDVGHTIPLGKLMPSGPFAGWWFVDLHDVK